MANNEVTGTLPKKMSSSTVALIALVLIVIGVVLGLYFSRYHLIKVPEGAAEDLILKWPDYFFLQDGDPPVTVSDGSLDAHSPHRWLPDGTDNGRTIRPVGTKLQATCGFGNNVSALFTYMGTGYNISPTGDTWAVEITYADDTVTVRTDARGLYIMSAKYTFDPAPASDRGHRKHNKKGGQDETTHIRVVGGTQSFNGDIMGPFELGFCYQ